MDGFRSLEAVRITFLEFVDVALEHFFKRHPEGGCRLGEIPGDVTKFLDKMLFVELVALAEPFLHDVDRFAGLPAKPHHAIEKDVFFLEGWVQGSHRLTLVFIDFHKSLSGLHYRRFETKRNVFALIHPIVLASMKKD